MRHCQETVGVSVMIFTISKINDFLSLSGDTNPLHSDDDFAEKHGFDERIVPGMMAVQASLHPMLPPKSLRASFFRPLFPDVDYKTGLDLQRELFWFGGKEKRVSIWRDCAVLVQHWTPADEPHVGDYHPSAVVPEKQMVLCFISWFVGSQLPGAGAILSNIEVEYMRDGNRSMDKLSYAVRIAQQSLGMVVLDAVLTEGDVPVAYCEIRAMEPRK